MLLYPASLSCVLHRGSFSAAVHLQDIRSLSAEIAAAVIKTAAEDGHACEEAAEQVAAGHDQLLDWVRKHMFTPTYSRCAASLSKDLHAVNPHSHDNVYVCKCICRACKVVFGVKCGSSCAVACHDNQGGAAIAQDTCIQHP